MKAAQDPSSPLTVHMIGNAHLDPVWLWHWQRGSDEAVATCRAACDILDDCPDAVFTRGEAWVYEQVRALDPPLLDRIRRHIQAGRWSVVGGWWVQPDVNLPTEEAILHSASLGHAWFREHLGILEIPVAYNVDSFGHGAFLPRMIRRAGQKYYVMMRPGQGEKELPSCCFRWRSPDGAEVLAFRILHTYCHNGPDLSWLVQAAIDQRPAGLADVMCFYGVGNHGGGLTRATVEWIRAHRDFAPGVRLLFSSPDRFFAAAEPFRDRLPVVSGELQMHAVGCYSVCGNLKRAIRRAELAAIDAGHLLLNTADPRRTRSQADDLHRAWQHIAFNQFHDILPGSAVSEAIAVAESQVASAQALIDQSVHTLLRAHGRQGPHSTLVGHRIQVVNRAPSPWSGLAEIEVWMDWQEWKHHVTDAAGRDIPFQSLSPASVMIEPGIQPIPRLLFPLSLAPLERRTLRIVPGIPPPIAMPGTDPSWDGRQLANDAIAVSFGPSGIAQIESRTARQPMLGTPLVFACFSDPSDTWSHGVTRYGWPEVHRAAFLAPECVEKGPWRTTVVLDGTLGPHPCQLRVSLERGAAAVHVRFATQGQDLATVLKAVLQPQSNIASALHRVAGGWLDRPRDGREAPLHHAIAVQTEHEGCFGLALPDTFATDVDGQCVRPTLARNTLHAFHSSRCHQPGHAVDILGVARRESRTGSDAGPQSYRMIVTVAECSTPVRLDELLNRIQHPPHLWDDYHGQSRLSRFDAP